MNLPAPLQKSLEQLSPALNELLAKLQPLVHLVYKNTPDFPHKQLVIGLFLLFWGLLLAYLFSRLCVSLLSSLYNLLRMDPNLRAEKHFARGRYDKAKRLFAKAGNHQKLAQCLVQLGEHLEAARQFELARDADSAARAYTQVGEHAKAAKLYEGIGRNIDAAERYEAAGDFMAAGLVYRRLRYLKKAEEMFDKVGAHARTAEMFQDEYKQEKRRPIEKVDVKNQEKRHNYMRELAKKAGEHYLLAENPAAAAASFLEGGHKEQAAEAYQRAGNFTEAAKLFLLANARAKAAFCYEQSGAYQEAITHYKTDGDHDSVARVLDRMGKTKEAAEYRAVLEVKRGQKIEAANSFVAAGRLAEAADLFKEVKAYDRAVKLYTQAGNRAAAGDTCVLAERFAEAAEHYAAANRFTSAAQCYLKLQDEPHYLEMLTRGGGFLEAGLYLESRDADRAIPILQKIEANSPDYRYASNLLGRIFLRKGMDSLAAEKLEEAIKGLDISKANLDFYYDLAMLRVRQGNSGEALKIYDKILANDYHYKDALALRNNLSAKVTTPGVGAALSLENNLPAGNAVKLISQRYRVEGELGRGGMGVVYKAHDGTLQRTVALKFLPPAITADENEIKKFLNEARSAARLNHPNIVTIYDIERDADTGNYYIVMEYIDGVNLKEIIEASHNLPLQVITLICSQICDALGYAHQKNVVHRDIKSANILWTNDKVVKVTDFGLAKIVEESLNASTKGQGSPVYMAPEQVLGQAVDHRADIYSLGISMYEMVTGKVPFERGDIGYHHLNTPPQPPLELRPDLPAYLNALILGCLEKDPAKRIQSAAEVRKLLATA